ncbi:MAG: hypothetical protein Q8K78_12335 [Planctomycetaceae bacterium]|nr:hypothetical protein [Planctomycetaceae bacterium]
MVSGTAPAGAEANVVTIDVAPTPSSTIEPPPRERARAAAHQPIGTEPWGRVELGPQSKDIVRSSPETVRRASVPNARSSAGARRITRASFQDDAAAQIPPPAPGIDDSQPNRELPQDGLAPSTTGQVRIPLVGDEPTENIELTMRNGRISLIARAASVQSVLNLLAQQQGLNLIAADDVDAIISVTLTNVPFEDALNAIVAIAGCTWTQQHGIVLISKVGTESRGTPDVQGKIVQVFPLNFVSAIDLELTIKGLLSPMGQIFTSQTSPADKRRTQEMVVVEDIPASVSRIAQYIQQVDQPPRQVMVEAHVLQIDLKDDTRHGVNWKYLTKIAGSDITLGTAGFANPLASPASFFSMDGDHLDLLVEALKTTTDAKTLANPKVIVANGQEARIQIGAKLGYFVTTTTQTSTLQNVNFLNTGVLLRVTPQISNDNRVLMVVRPEVSTGKISPLGLPETNTTEAETTVLLEDGGGMVIGGLIRETNTDTQDKVPILGDLWLVGRFFQKRNYTRERSEIVIVLIPRIAPYTPDYQAYEGLKVLQASEPLFQNGLQPTVRPFDPALPDAINNPRRIRPYRFSSLFDKPSETNPKPLRYYFPTMDEELNPPDGPIFDRPLPEPSPFDPLPAPVYLESTPSGVNELPPSPPLVPPIGPPDGQPLE